MSKKKDNTKKAEEKAPAASETPEMNTTAEGYTKNRTTFAPDQRKIDVVRIRPHILLECDIDPEQIETEIALSGVEYDVESSREWFIIWVKA